MLLLISGGLPTLPWRHSRDALLLAAAGMRAIRISSDGASQVPLLRLLLLLQLPAQSVLKAPIWTTWARYKTEVSQTKVRLLHRRECWPRI